MSRQIKEYTHNNYHQKLKKKQTQIIISTVIKNVEKKRAVFQNVMMLDLLSAFKGQYFMGRVCELLEDP